MFHRSVKRPAPWALPNAQRRSEMDASASGRGSLGISLALCRNIGIGDRVCFELSSKNVQCGVDDDNFDIRFECEGGIHAYRNIQSKKAAVQKKVSERAAARDEAMKHRRNAHPERIRTASLLHRGASGSTLEETSAQRSARLIAETKGLIKSFRRMRG